MYEANGNKAGFYVRRRTWGNTYARVVAVGGRAEGPLPGEPPYFGNPEVLVDVFKNDGRQVASGDVLSCPGTYSYEQIPPPPSL